MFRIRNYSIFDVSAWSLSCTQLWTVSSVVFLSSSFSIVTFDLTITSVTTSGGLSCRSITPLANLFPRFSWQFCSNLMRIRNDWFIHQMLYFIPQLLKLSTTSWIVQLHSLLGDMLDSSRLGVHVTVVICSHWAGDISSSFISIAPLIVHPNFCWLDLKRSIYSFFCNFHSFKRHISSCPLCFTDTTPFMPSR